MFSAFFFALAHAIALWFVPLSSVLEARNLGWLTPFALASTALAAFISPMVSGALADRHFCPVRLIRFLCLSSGLFLFLTFEAIEKGWPSLAILALLQIQQLCNAPVWGLASMTVLASLPNPGRQFGAIRVWGTFGWIAACLVVSFILHADHSPLSGLVSAANWLAVAALTFWLPAVPPQAAPAPRRWTALLGLESLELLRHQRHRSVFLTAGLLSIPLAAFYPFAALQLRDLGIHSVSASMALGQVTEAAAMYALGPLLSRFPLQRLLLCALLACLARYLLFSLHHTASVLLGVFLHGICFTLFFIPAQIYIEQHIDKALRFRAQALLTLLISGFGNLAGYLGCGWLRSLFTSPSGTRWPAYWLTLSLALLLVGVYFVHSYPADAPQKDAPLPPKLP